MIDVNKITSTLAKLPDAQLQQYAQMHKNDPYIMALAMTESNRRKEMRSAGQGAQGMQEQPKVVDQEIAQMAPQQLPEEQGIGRLPAGNMDFAGGGIVAFADGGDIERYNGTAGSLTGNAPGDTEGYWSYRDTDEGIRRAFRDTIREGEAYTPSIMGSLFGYNVLPKEAKNKPATEKPAAEKPAAEKIDKSSSKGNTGDPLGASGAPGAPSMGSLMTPKGLADFRQDIYNKQTFVDPAAKELADLETRERASAEEGLASLKRDQARFEDAYKGREARLTAREADIGKQKDTNTGLAFLNAGLAMMSTPGGLAMAIGKGARVGTEQYAAGLDKIRSAQERLDEARDKMEDLKLNRAEMSAKEIRAAEKDIRNTGIDAKKRGIDGIRMAADVNEKRATDIFSKSVDLTKTVYEQQSANARSAAGIAAQLNTPDRLVFNQLVRENGGDNVKAAEALQKMKAEKLNIYETYAKYLTGFAGKDTVTPPEPFDKFAARFVIPTTKTPDKGATVLQQP